jgi:protein YIPF6
MSQTFVLVFFIMWFGGTIVTINSILLGSKINLFQSLCVLGYCLFPILIASILLSYLQTVLNLYIRLGIGGGAFIWSSTSSIAFMGDIVGQDKKVLSVYPIYLFYFCFCCYLLL